MSIPSAVNDVLRAVDARDADRFVSYLAPDGTFRFGNAPATNGREATREAVAAFFEGVVALRHELLGTWSAGEMVFCKGEVTYTRRDGSQVGPLPFFNLFRMRGDQIVEYLIYADVTPLYEPRRVQESGTEDAP
jgi:limonene-1,2-epoxide hydrolase